MKMSRRLRVGESEREERGRILSSVAKVRMFEEQKMLDMNNSKDLSKTDGPHGDHAKISIVIVAVLLFVLTGTLIYWIRRGDVGDARGFVTERRLKAPEGPSISEDQAREASLDGPTNISIGLNRAPQIRKVEESTDSKDNAEAHGISDTAEDQQIRTEIVENDIAFELIRFHWDGADRDIYGCRIYRICRGSSGELILPESLKNSKKFAYCGVSRIGSGPPKFVSDEEMAHETMIDYDWLSGTLARYHMPHFAPDALPGIFALDGVLHTHRRTQSSMRMFAFEMNGNRKVVRSLNGVKPLILIENKWADLPNNSWVGNFIDMIPPVSQKEERKVMSLSDAMKASKTVERVCFRSALLSSFTTDFGIVLDSSSAFYRENHLTRDWITDCEGGSSRITILIINRRGDASKDGNVKLGRNIVNVDELEQALNLAARNSDVQSGEAKLKLTLDVRVRYFEELTFAEQVREMQEADLIIGAHGAALANVVFSRRGVTLIEIVPYTYYAGPFNGQAKQLGLKFLRFVAEPDVERFTFCIDHFNKVGSSTYEAAQELKRRFEDGARGVMERGETSLNLQLQDSIDLKVSFTRPCARAQRLKIDVTAVSQSAMDVARGIVIARNLKA